MKVFIIFHHEIMGTPEDCHADEMVCYCGLKLMISTQQSHEPIRWASKLYCLAIAIHLTATADQITGIFGFVT